MTVLIIKNKKNIEIDIFFPRFHWESMLMQNDRSASLTNLT